MQLSEAMALGSLVVKAQAGGEIFEDGSGCARGMALEAVGKRVKLCNESVSFLCFDNYTAFLKEWPWTKLPVTLNMIPEKFRCNMILKQLAAPPGHHPTTATILAHTFDIHVMGNTCGYIGGPEEYLDLLDCMKHSLILQDLIDWVKSIEPPAIEIKEVEHDTEHVTA